MSVRKLTAKLIAALVVTAMAQTVHAQEHLPPADPFAFDPDFRWFEPIYEADIVDMKPSKRANTGWYATYDRLHLYGSRPELFGQGTGETKLDEGQGHRYEVGYMLPQKDTGFNFNWTQNGVSQSDFVRQERLNRYSAADLATIGAEGGSGDPDANPVVPPFGFIVPIADRNNLGYNTRFYDITDTENVMDFNSLEFSKTWRMEPYHYGGILEPMVGLRYMKLTDTNMFQQYNSTFNTFGLPLAPNLGGAPFAIAEQLISNVSQTENDMFAGQVGFRYFKHQGRFLYSTDFKVFSGGNWQCSRNQTTTERTIYVFGVPDDGLPTITIGDPPEGVQVDKTVPVYSRNEEFIVGFDVRGELGYQLTKAISIRGGFQLIDLGRGVWRGGVSDGTIIGGRNDQDVLMVGGTFGLTLNR